MLYVFSGHVNAHEIEPAIVSVSIEGDVLNIEVELSLEAVLAGLDLSATTNSGGSQNEAEYTRLRALSPDALSVLSTSEWSKINEKLSLHFNDKDADINLHSINVEALNDLEVARLSTLRVQATIPPTASNFQFGWTKDLGLMVLRRVDLENGFAGYVEPGELSPRMAIYDIKPASNWQTFVDFIPVGFDHIIPKGLDHILFVVGLFLFAAQFRPLLLQISAFTVAHTITLALASLNLVVVPASIVEPLIAISIAYVAIENIFVSKISLHRPLIIFAFGLLHGLGFASVLSDFGLPGAGFVAALVGFNVGVELGQLAVIAVCFLGFAYWFKDRSWYRTRIVVPSSAVIALIGIWWAFERIFLG